MNKNQSFRTKLIYGVCMIVLLVAISLVSRPATSDKRNQGGWLAQMRNEYDISDAKLGKVDPASEAMRLSLLGLDGVAIVVLWHHLNEYQMREQYTLMEATARTISYLNPHLLKVWEFQAWNMSYNVSREFDNYKHRYLWVKRGIEYHMQGTEYNYNEPRMMNSIAHFFGNKFGTADEKEQYREIFPDDELFHASIQERLEGTKHDINENSVYTVDGKPDNWLVARTWNSWAVEVVDDGLGTIGGMSPTIFYQYPAKRLMNFGEAVEKEGQITEKAQKAWADAHKGWIDFSQHELSSTYGIPIRLGDSKDLGETLEELEQEFSSKYGEYQKKARQEKMETLSTEVRIAVETPERLRTEEQLTQARLAQHTLRTGRFDVVRYMERNNIEGYVEAAKIAKQMDDAEFLKGVIDRQREIVAYDYWLARAAAEKESDTLKARQLVYDAHQAYSNANLIKAKGLYEEAWKHWIEIYERHPEVRNDASSEDLAVYLKEYRSLLNQLDLDITPDFPLIDILRENSELFIEPQSSASSTLPENQSLDLDAPTSEPAADSKPSADENEKAESDATNQETPEEGSSKEETESEPPTTSETSAESSESSESKSDAAPASETTEASEDSGQSQQEPAESSAQ